MHDTPITANDVSVIIPAYQAEPTLQRAIDSVLQQTVAAGEIIVIDDGSTDATIEVAKRCAATATDSNIRVLAQNNLGAGAARNRGLESASGCVVAFLDADDEWLPEKLARSIDQFNAEKADLVAHDYFRLENDQSTYVDCARHFRESTDRLKTYFLRGYIATSTVIARRDMILDVGGFDPSLRSGQDYELWLAILCKPNIRHHVFPEALVRYHLTANSITSLVELRRQAAVRIMYRHLPALKGIGRSARGVGVLRAVIICLQAAQGHIGQRHYFGFLQAILRIPFQVLSIAQFPLAEQQVRPNFLKKNKDPA